MNVKKKAAAGKHGRSDTAYEVMSAENIGRVAGGIAHDLNTILTTIYGYCEQALGSAGSLSEAGQSIMKITGAADKARALTEQLLNLRRRNDKDKSVVRLNDIVSETLSFVRPSLPDKVKIVRRLTTADIFVTADPTKLFRVFLNLAVNAIQAMDKDGGRLTVILRTVEAEAGTGKSAARSALVRFSDTGSGMDHETSSRMFEPFFTAGKDERGTGLGLTIVRDIINSVNGDIRVISEPGAGTIIDVLIPLTDNLEGHSRSKKAVEK
jgi:signal transduction histidine kinase